MLLVRPPTTITLMCTIIALYFITMTNLISTTLKICMYRIKRTPDLALDWQQHATVWDPFPNEGTLYLDLISWSVGHFLDSSQDFVPYPGGRLTGQVYPPTVTKRSQCVVKPTIEKQASLSMFMFKNKAVDPLSQYMCTHCAFSKPLCFMLQ